MFLYCWDRIAVAGGKVDRVFYISSASDIVSPQSRSWAVIWCSSELNVAKSGKSNTLKLIQSDLAWGRNKVCWWLNRACRSAHSSAGSSICRYYSRNEWSKCLLICSKACHLAAGGICGTGSVDVEGWTVSVLAKSSALRTVLASFIHS